MRTTEAVDIVNCLAVHPGWRVEASDHSHRFRDTISVRFTLTDGRNSDEAEAPDYATPVPPDGPRATFPIHVGDISSERELVGRVIDIMVENFTHEVREFTRTQDADGRWIAPFHPHRHEGIAAWSERTGRDPQADYLFGLA